MSLQNDFDINPKNATGPNVDVQGIANGDDSDVFEARSRLDQPSLFPDEEFYLPDSLSTFRKSHSIITSIALNKSHTLNTRRLMDATAIVAQIECRKRGPEFIQKVLNERVSPMFETRVTELATLADITGKNYVRLRDALNSLYDLDFAWNALGSDGQVAWNARSHYFSYLGFGQGDKSSLIRFAMDPAVLGLVLEPNMWARFNLASKKGLGTSAAYALWQFAFRYLGTPKGLTAAIPTEVFVEMLVGPSKYVKKVKDKSVVSYGEFKRRVLQDALVRVNDNAALTHTLELKEILSGKRVVKVQFKFHPKKQAALDLPPLAWPQEAVDLLSSMGFSPTELSALAQGNSYVIIADALERLPVVEQKIRARGDVVHSRKALFNGILDRVAKGSVLADITDESLQEELRVRDAEQAALVRKQRMDEAFSLHQRDVFAKNLLAMSAEDRDELAQLFLDSDKGKANLALVERSGWTTENVGLMAVFRGWLKEFQVDAYNRLLPYPQDRTIEAWMSWKLDPVG